MLRYLVLLIALAIAIQNTCPYGYAGKTALAAQNLHHCPLKDHQPSGPDRQDDIEEDFSNAGQAFTFVSVPGCGYLEALDAIESAGIPISADYHDVFLTPPPRPPEA